MNIILKKNPRVPRERRVTIAVGKNVFKKSTERNLFRRRVRSILLPVLRSSKFNLLVIAKPKAAGLDFTGLKEEILEQIEKI